MENEWQNEALTFRIGEAGPHIILLQNLIKNPVTGVWSAEDQTAYLSRHQRIEYLRLKHKMSLPANWVLVPEP